MLDALAHLKSSFTSRPWSLTEVKDYVCHVNFYRLHVAFFLALNLVGSLIFWCVERNKVWKDCFCEFAKFRIPYGFV